MLIFRLAGRYMLSDPAILWDLVQTPLYPHQEALLCHVPQQVAAMLCFIAIVGVNASDRLALLYRDAPVLADELDDLALFVG